MIDFVVMGNDYPDAVFSSGSEAEAYCKQKNDLNEVGKRRIHWCAYEFPLKGHALAGLIEAAEPFARAVEHLAFLGASDDEYVNLAPFKAGQYRALATALAAHRAEGEGK